MTAILVSSQRPPTSTIATARSQIEDGVNTQQPYTTATGSGIVTPVPRPPVADGPAEVTDFASEWLRTDAARQFEGQWVALTPDRVVRAHGPSPSAVRDTSGPLDGRMIIYVMPRGIRFVG
jgi:hypothetical protein